MVVSRNPRNGKTELKRVLGVSKTLSHDLFTVEFADAKTGKVVETIRGTSEHPFFVEGRGFVPLAELGVGTTIVPRAGPTLVVKSLTRESHPEGIFVYNFEVDDYHTYFVGKHGAGIWVHNDCVGTVDDILNNIDDDLFFHYTNEAGFKGILKDNTIKAGMKGRVHVTQEMFSSAQADATLYIGASTHAGRATHIFAFKMQPGSLIKGKPGELFQPGALRFDVHKLIYAGPNPF